MNPHFVHLHLHSEYSLVDGVVRIPELIDSCIDNDMPAVALTDQANLFAAVKFYQAAQKAGIKPILGAELLILNPKDTKNPFRLIVLCQTQQGWQNLITLITNVYISGQSTGLPLISIENLIKNGTGLIILSGALQGDIGAALLNDDNETAEILLQSYIKAFPNRFYIELQRTGRQGESKYIQAVVKLAAKYQVPLVASNDVRFIRPDDYESHEARVCIHNSQILTDPKRPRIYSEQQYLRTPNEMLELFSDIPEALKNSVEIAKRCNVQLRLGDNILPDFPVPEDLSIEEYLTQETEVGLKKRINPIPESYQQRLMEELSVINSMGFAGYFLIVADFIHWAKEHGIPVGPGRGSGAGSLVAYALDITDLDPIRYDLLFERFLNPERISMPDFDIDFCMEGRDRVIEYVADRYGRDSVSQIITFGTMAAKAVIRDVGRVLGMPYGFVDTIAKSVPFELGMTLSKALDQEEAFAKRYKDEDEVRNLIDLALKLEGIVRNAGKHAGGVVIAPSKLTDFTALYCESGAKQLVTQFDKDDVELAGLVKFDFLGLRTLTIINWAVQSINQQREKKGEDLLDIRKIPTDDVKTYDLLKSCATTAVFQLESRGMKDLIKRLQPDSFEEIVALVALFRPGPLQSGMVEDFIDRKHERTKVEYLHPELEAILSTTYGVILYQEQVMQIAQALAGYTLGAADILRRAMGKKKQEEMAKQREFFLSGASKRHIDEKIASTIFNLMEKFAGYGFNKSHSAAYALVAYQTAWLKAHYPAEFMAAVLSSDMDNTDKVATFMNECLQMKLTVEPPQINHSSYKFIPSIDGAILYGLGAIKGVGESAIEAIVAERIQNGDFTDIVDFCERCDLRKVNRRVIESLIRSGAMDVFEITRASLHSNLGAVLKNVEQKHRALALGQEDLFALDISYGDSQSQIVVNCPEWSMEEILQGEKETLGLYLSGHPLDRYREELSHFVTTDIGSVSLQQKSITLAGLIVNLRTMQTKRGDRMAFLTLGDASGRIELTVFAKDYKTYQPLLIKDNLLIVDGEISVDECTGSFRINTRYLMTLSEAREQYAQCLLIKLPLKQFNAQLMKRLQSTVQDTEKGNCPICVQFEQESATSEVWLGAKWRIMPNEELLNDLYAFLGQDAIKFRYLSESW